MNEYLISSLEQQLKKDPDSRVFFRLAEEYRKGAAYDRAMQICLEGLKHHPNYLAARVCLGRCRQNLGLLDEAESDFLEILDTSPDNPHALRGLASIYYSQQKWEQALPYYESLALHDTFDGEVTDRIFELKQREAGIILDEDSDTDDQDLDDAAVVEIPHEIEIPEDNQRHETESDLDSDEQKNDETERLTELNEVMDADAADDVQTVPENLDAVFEKALQEEEETEILLEFKEEPATVPDALPATLSTRDERLLTKGLKHEKMEHYEAAARIYKALLTRTTDPSVREHLDRVTHFMKTESGNRKKIRLLSNWLDKIKGVYYVS